MQIEIYSDMVCPWCYIGKQNINKAIEQWNNQGGESVSVTYRAYQLDPSLPPEGLPFKEAMASKMGNEAQMKQALEQVTQAGASVGVTFQFEKITRMPNTKLAHRFVALLPEELKEAAVVTIFRAYFEEGRDIALSSEIEAIAKQLGDAAIAVLEQLAQGEGEASVTADLELGRTLGITGVPFFVFNNKYALSGAYPPDKLLQLMERITKEG